MLKNHLASHLVALNSVPTLSWNAKSIFFSFSTLFDFQSLSVLLFYVSLLLIDTIKSSHCFCLAWLLKTVCLQLYLFADEATFGLIKFVKLCHMIWGAYSIHTWQNSLFKLPNWTRLYKIINNVKDFSKIRNVPFVL